MKKLLFICLLIPTIAFAQVHISMGGGYDVATSKPLGKLVVGTNIHNFVLDGEMNFSITRESYVNNYFTVKAGYEVHNFIASIGIYHNYVSSDNKELNHNYAGYSLTKIIPICDDGRALFGSVLYTEMGFQITAGIYCKIE